MWMLIATPPLRTVEQFDAVTAEAGTPEGLEGRWCGRTAAGDLRVVTLWSSKEAADRFLTDRLGPAFARVLGPEAQGRPEIAGLDVLRAWTPMPVA
jgi:hypothetical protein